MSNTQLYQLKLHSYAPQGICKSANESMLWKEYLTPTIIWSVEMSIANLAKSLSPFLSKRRVEAMTWRSVTWSNILQVLQFLFVIRRWGGSIFKWALHKLSEWTPAKSIYKPFLHVLYYFVCSFMQFDTCSLKSINWMVTLISSVRRKKLFQTYM